MNGMRELALGCFAVAATWAGPAHAWRPDPPPPGCAEYTAELDLVDVSRSMLAQGRLAAAKGNLSSKIEAAPRCAYIAVATFGLTSDIVAAGYPEIAEDRDRLKRAVGALRAIARYTDQDEAAKSAELFILQLAAQRLKPHPITIVSYTDDISAPSAGKPAVSLATALASRMEALHLQVADDFGGWPPAPPGARRIHVSELPAALPADPPPAPPDGPAANNYRRRIAAWGLALVLGLAATVWLARRRRPAAAAPVFAPGALVVSEFEEDDRGELTVLSDSMGRPKRSRRVLLYDSQSPIRFSADPGLGDYVVERGADIPGKQVLFSVTPAGGFDVSIEGEGVAVDGEPPPPEGVTVTARDGITVKFGRRAFQLGLEEADAPAELRS